MPALAAPAPLPDWGVKGKPADKPTDTPAAKPGEKAVAPLPDWGVAGKPKARPGKPKKTRRGGSKASEAEPEPDAPAAGEPEPTTAEPTVPEPASTGPTPDAATATPAAPAPEPADAAEPMAASDTQERTQLQRRGRGELITGVVFMAGGLAGFGVLGAGLYLKGKADDELEDAEGRTDVDLRPLQDQKKQGETMLAAGAVAGVLGMALGIALVAAGARDMKAGRAGRLARLRVAPTFGGLVISGRF